MRADGGPVVTRIRDEAGDAAPVLLGSRVRTRIDVVTSTAARADFVLLARAAMYARKALERCSCSG